MRTRRLLLAGLAFAASRADAQKVVFDPQNHSIASTMTALPVHVGGRVVITALGPALPKGAKRYLHEWPGVYFESAFAGDRVLLKFDDPLNEYRLLIDGMPPLKLAQPGSAEVTVSGFAAGPHKLRLEKVTESAGHAAAFEGFYISRGERPLPALPPRRHQIEYIGDSSMAGYGDRSPTPVCAQPSVRLLTDSQAAYPAIVARHYDADFQLNAISGRGLIRNFADSAPDRTMQQVYRFALPSRKLPYSDPAWQPQIVVVKLNADFVGALKPDGPWKDLSQVARAYVPAMGQFVAALHARYPKAAILLWWFDFDPASDPQGAPFARASRDYVVAAARAEGVTSIDFLPMKDLGYEGTGCDHHPSLNDHRKTAAWLIGYLDAHPGYWQGR